MAKKPIDLTNVHSAKRLYELTKEREQEDKKIRLPVKLNVKRKTYGLAKIRADFPGALLFVDQAFPEARYSEDRRVEEANEVIHWHRRNGTLDTLRSTYRGDFYKPEPGSPEESIYWGDFYDNKSYTKVVAQERALRDLRKEYSTAEKMVEEAGNAIEENFKKSKAQQYRWKRRLTQINEESTHLYEYLNTVMPTSFIPAASDPKGVYGIPLEQDERLLDVVDLDGVPLGQMDYKAMEKFEKSVMDKLSFREIQKLIRSRDRLATINVRKAHVLHKMRLWEEEQPEVETALMEDLMDAQNYRDEIRDKLEGLAKNRGTRTEEVQGFMRLRNALVHKSPELPRLIAMHEKKGTLQFFEGTSIGEMLREHLEKRDERRQRRKDKWEITKVKDGTLYKGKVTIPPHSTVEVDLDELAAENDEGIENAKQITLRTDALRTQKLEQQQKQSLRTSINTKTVQNIATMLPSAMINASKDIPRTAGATMRHDMETLGAWDLVGKNDVQCRALPKVINGREVDHARNAIALRGGIIVPRDIFLIDVLHHWKTNFYVCQVITHDQNKLCALALGVERGGRYAGKLVARTAFFWRPDIWTVNWEAENRRISAEQPGVTLEQLRQEHERLVSILPMPNQVTDILGITMNDPVTSMVFN